MSIMFPESPLSFTTPGEARVFKFLQAAGKPDKNYLVWYSPLINDLEPDFVLYSQRQGLIVLEVKDWTLDQILEADPKQVTLSLAGKRDIRKNPMEQSREYVSALMNFLKRSHFIGQDGRLRVPLCGGVALTNIDRDAFTKSGLGTVLPANKILFCDDISENSLLTRDISGSLFSQWLDEHLPPLFPNHLTCGEVNTLRGLLFPSLRIVVPARPSLPADKKAESHGMPSEKISQQDAMLDEGIKVMDQRQEQVALSLTHGSTVILGPAGSGKTQILAHLAATWHRQEKKRILFLCFNLSLAGYLRRMLSALGIPLGEAGVEIMPFYDVCAKILNAPVLDSENSEYYQNIIEKVNDSLHNSRFAGMYDAILVDEGQDFDSSMTLAVWQLLRQTDGILTVAVDPEQMLYHAETKKISWLDIPYIKKRSLRAQYRCTSQIAAFAHKTAFGEENTPVLKEYAEENALNPEDAGKILAGFDGSEPEILPCTSSSELPAKAAKIAAALHQAGVPMSEIAILYVSSKLPNGKPLPLAVIDALEKQGLMAIWPAEDGRAKRRYDITTDSVTVSTIHSVKGMDFAHVILLQSESMAENMTESFRRLLYVGMTRARLGLTVIQYK